MLRYVGETFSETAKAFSNHLLQVPYELGGSVGSQVQHMARPLVEFSSLIKVAVSIKQNQFLRFWMSLVFLEFRRLFRIPHGVHCIWNPLISRHVCWYSLITTTLSLVQRREPLGCWYRDKWPVDLPHRWQIGPWCLVDTDEDLFSFCRSATRSERSNWRSYSFSAMTPIKSSKGWRGRPDPLGILRGLAGVMHIMTCPASCKWSTPFG